MKSVDLQLGQVYITPLGRRCRLLPTKQGEGRWGGAFVFRYLPGSARDCLRTGDGFHLSPGNVRHLRVEGAS